MPRPSLEIGMLLDELSSLLRNGRMTFMEVCGTHTVSIFRSGLRSLLPEGLRLLSGPGCPVCVTDQAEIDMAVSLTGENRILLTYGDMLRIPGSEGSLMDRKVRGAAVEVVTSAFQALDIARENRDKEIVFLGVGFETTAPATAVALQRAESERIPNFSVLCLHKTVPPVMHALCGDPSLLIDGFILPGNVTVITGLDDFGFLAEQNKAASAAGFEPEEILAALVDLARQVVKKEFRLNAYRLQDTPRMGNPAARKILEQVFVPADAQWRGLGTIPRSGYRIAERYSHMDSARRFGLSLSSPLDRGCECGGVLSGKITPPECKLYGTACTPFSPAGPCMVSSEGTCGAWYRYR